MYCITAMPVTELTELIGNDFVTRFQSEMDPVIDPLRKHIALGRPLSLGKELWEYAVTDSIKDAVWNGAGHSIVDVRIGEHVGIDVKGVSKNNKSKNTTEASMFQNFNQDAKRHFENRNAEGVWNIHVKGWMNKIKEVDNYYILGIIREKETLDCSMCGFKIQHMDLDYQENSVKFNRTSMHLFGLADQDFISIRYYNSKSRIEIMFKPKCWTDPVYSLPIYKF